MVTLAQQSEADSAAVRKMGFKVDEAATIAGCNPWTIRRAIQAGQIKSFRVLNRVLIHRSELERVIGGPVA